MNLFSRAMARFGLTGLINPEKGEQDTGNRPRTTDAGVTVNDDNALQVSAAWACTEIITNSLASLPMEWHRMKRDGTKAPLEIEHPVSRLFWGRPNKFMKMRDVKRALAFQLCLFNNAYALIDWSPDGGRPVALMPLHPSRMRVMRTEAGTVYLYKTDDGDEAYSDKSILHLKGISIEGLAGLNRLDFMRPTLGLSQAARTYGSKQFANGGKPGSVLKTDKFLNPEQRELMRQLYENVSAGASNANRIWVLEGGVDYVGTTESPDKMQMLQTREHTDVEICRFFGVPSILIGAGTTQSSAWPASFEGQVLSFLTFTLQSYVDEFEQGFMDALLQTGERRNIIAEHDEADFIRMDSTAKANYFSRLAQNGLMTRNEGRSKLKLPKSDDPNADELTIQTNLSTLEGVPTGAANNADISQNQ